MVKSVIAAFGKLAHSLATILPVSAQDRKLIGPGRESSDSARAIGREFATAAKGRPAFAACCQSTYLFIAMILLIKLLPGKSIITIPTRLLTRILIFRVW